MRNESSHAASFGSNRTLEKLVIFHFSLLLIFATWAFGGQARWAREGIALWGGVGVLLFLAICVLRKTSTDTDAPRPPLWSLLWPLGLYDLVVIVSCFNPSFVEVGPPESASLVMTDSVAWLPSAARPALAARELWQFNVLVLSCFNLYLTLGSRRAVRKVLFVVATNAVVLAIFGTFQKLIKAKGLWLGLVKSPNDKFFSTFIYHNHWGAFTVLCTAVCLGLLFHSFRRGGHRDFWHSPAFLGAVATFLLALSVPLSTSRSSTLLMAGLLGGALMHFLARIIRRRRQMRESAILPVAVVGLVCVLALAAIGYLGRDVITQRANLTTQQLAHIAEEDGLNSRLTLYRDTWRMASEKPVFGWGLESYAHVFRVFNTQRAAELWIWITFYAEAHNDWFQSLAEVGFVGTGLLLLLGLLPLLSIRWTQVGSTLPRYLLAGCALVLLYAWVEFPFANPAVMLTFWAVFYCAIRYSALDLQLQDEESHR